MGSIKSRPFVPLRPDEVKPDMILFLDRQEKVNGTFSILGECPFCHEQRWIQVYNLRGGHTKTTRCRRCQLQQGNLVLMRPDEAPAQDCILYFDQQKLVTEKKGRMQQMLRILAECPDCHKQRWVRVNSFRNGKIRTTFCNPCSRKRQPHPVPKIGRQDSNGYVMIHLTHLSPEDRLLAEQYLKIHRECYVYEHRIVALKHYGPEAAAPGVVVRHIDGNKKNNAPDNLRLGSQGDNARDHVQAIAEMKRWRGLAFYLLSLLVQNSQATPDFEHLLSQVD